MRNLFFLPLLLVFLSSQALAFHVRTACWNVENKPNNESEDSDFRVVFNLMGPVSVLVLTESDTVSADRTLAVLNELFPDRNYKMEISSAVWYDRIAVIYADSVIDLLNSDEINDSTLTRPVMVLDFRPDQLVSTENPSSHDFRIYGAHLKSGPDLDDELARGEEAAFLRDHIENSTFQGSVLVLGDLNLSNSSEPAWTNLVDQTKLLDLAQSPGEWRGNWDFRHLHTQGSDGLHLRLDFVLGSNCLTDNSGLEFLDGSYSVLGNNGTHPLYGGVSEGSGASDEELMALESASDHLPVVADLFHLPVVHCEPSPFAGHVRVEFSAVPGSTYHALQRDYLDQDSSSWAYAGTATAGSTSLNFDYPVDGQMSAFWKIQPALDPSLD